MSDENVFSGPEFSALFESIYKTLEGESDRGAVLVASSLIEKGLEKLISAFLLETESSKDELFSGAMAPLSTLDAKISMACRLGLIRPKVKSYLNIFRKIRNDFAHNVETYAFDNASVRNRLNEIYALRKDASDYLDQVVNGVQNKKTTREKFLLFFALDIAALQRVSKEVERLRPLTD